MSNQMKMKYNKAKVLEAVRDGRLKPEDLRDPDFIVVREKDDGYKYQETVITNAEYEKMVNSFNESEARRKAFGLPTGYFITIRYDRHKK